MCSIRMSLEYRSMIILIFCHENANIEFSKYFAAISNVPLNDALG